MVHWLKNNNKTKSITNEKVLSKISYESKSSSDFAKKTNYP